MIDISPYLLAGFNHLPKTQATIDGEQVDVVFNTITHNDAKELGGYVNEAEFTIFIKTSLLNDPVSLKGELVTIHGSNYRIVSVKYGETVTSLFAQSVNTA